MQGKGEGAKPAPISPAYKHRETIKYKTPDGGQSFITVGLTQRDQVHIIIARGGRQIEAFFNERQAQSIADMMGRAIALASHPQRAAGPLPSPAKCG